MAGAHNHGACVDAWLGRETDALEAESLVELLQRGLDALWKRAHQPLGEVTLTAIAERVLYTAAERFPPLVTLSICPTGIRCQTLREQAAEVPREELLRAIRFVLVELLTVLGNLTANILTPGLHAALAKVTAPERDQREGPAQ